MTERELERRSSRLAEAYHVGLLREVVKAGKITRTRGRLLEQCWRAFGRLQRTSPGSKGYVKRIAKLADLIKKIPQTP